MKEIEKCRGFIGPGTYLDNKISANPVEQHAGDKAVNNQGNGLEKKVGSVRGNRAISDGFTEGSSASSQLSPKKQQSKCPKTERKEKKKSARTHAPKREMTARIQALTSDRLPPKLPLRGKNRGEPLSSVYSLHTWLGTRRSVRNLHKAPKRGEITDFLDVVFVSFLIFDNKKTRVISFGLVEQT